VLAGSVFDVRKEEPPSCRQARHRRPTLSKKNRGICLLAARIPGLPIVHPGNQLIQDRINVERPRPSVKIFGLPINHLKLRLESQRPLLALCAPPLIFEMPAKLSHPNRKIIFHSDERLGGRMLFRFTVDRQAPTGPQGGTQEINEGQKQKRDYGLEAVISLVLVARRGRFELPAF
jgi:hypothetical protein